MLRTVDRDTLLGDIYTAATDPTHWRTVFKQFRQAFCGHTAVYERRHSDPETHQLLVSDLDPEYVQRYNSHYNARNVWATSPLNQAASIMVCEQIIAPRALERTDFYGEWLHPQGLKYAVTCQLARQERRSINLGLVRDNRRGTYDAHEVQFLESVLPHLRRAIEIGERAEAANLVRDASLASIASSSVCLFLVNRSRAVVFASDEAERLLAASSVFAVWGGRLAAIDRTEAARLDKAIHAATTCEGVPTGTLLQANGGDLGTRYSVAVAPIEGERLGLISDQRLCAVMVGVPRKISNVEAFGQLFGWTPAETKLAQSLCNGGTLSNYAAASGIGVATVKTHLAALFGKTGVNRQADLVRMILTDPLVSGAPQ